MKRTPFAIVCVLSLAVATVAIAQEAEMQAEPGVVVVRYFQCSDQDEAVRLLNGTWRSVVEELVGFHEAIEVAFERVGERVPEEDQGRFGEICSTHKDNIYQVVQPPSEEEQGGGEGQDG